MTRPPAITKFLALGAVFAIFLAVAVPGRKASGREDKRPAAEKPDQDLQSSDPRESPDPQKSFWARFTDLFQTPAPQQPIAYTHKKHLAVGMECANCHQFAETGPQAGIPNADFCMVCHQAIATESPEIQKMTALWKQGKDIPWVRVYGFEKEAHVRFDHAPHIRAKVECQTCHGDMTQETVARELVKHTMGSCLECHKQKEASLDCMTCHF